jgi:DNA-binding response OmpR family regulator
MVEGDSSVREIIRDALKTYYHVLEASCYAEASKYFEAPFHLALIDCMLPDCDGFDIAKKAREKKPLLPIILMTAFSHENIIMRALRAGLTDYIKKPGQLWGI